MSNDCEPKTNQKRKSQEEDAVFFHDEWVCPICKKHSLRYFSGLGEIPEYHYCPKCNDWAYDEDGKRLFQLV